MDESVPGDHRHRRPRSDSHAELPLDPDVGARPLHLQPAAVALVALGALGGTALRYLAEEAFTHPADGWPWATFVINLIGAVILGALLEGLARLGPDSGWRQRARLCLGTGGCGAFTTYSTFALEGSLLVRGGHAGLAVAYMTVTLVAGVFAAWVGITVAARLHAVGRGSH